MPSYSSIKPASTFGTNAGKAFIQAGIDSSTISSLIPTTGSADSTGQLTAVGNDIGDQKVVGNNLYIWNGTGWFRIALINATPTWDAGGQPDASYTLDADSPQDATVITIAASDSDGFAITYSYITGGSMDSIATISQDSSVFTITPKTLAQMGNNSGPHTGTITFRASDGVNILPYVSSFTLHFVVFVENSNFTRLLMTTDNAAGGNQSITDSSSNNHTISVAGPAYAGTFSPHRHGGYSTHFNGSTDYLTIADSSEHDFSAGEFSIEFFWKPETLTGNTSSIHIAISCANDGSTQFIYHESNYWYFQGGSAGAIVLNSSGTGAATVNQWNHVVLCRTGTTLSIFHNGTRTATMTSSYNADFSNATIGKYYGSTANYFIDGLIRDMRWLKGSSAYDATQSSITVPIEPLTAVTNTKLLLCHLPYIKDGSSSSHTITTSGSTHTQPLSPYDNREYLEADNGGSIFFDESLNDEVTIVGSGATINTARTAGAFTYECWYYPLAQSGYDRIFGHDTPYNMGALFSYNGTPRFYDDGGYIAGNTIQTKTWTHFAVTYDGSKTVLYQNGVNVAEETSPDFSGTNDISIGDTTYELHGYVSDFRTSNTVVYSSNFNPPTAPLSSTGSIIHIKCTDAHVLDKSQTFNLELKGNTASTAALTASSSPPRIGAAWDNTSAIVFDGDGDYIPIISNFFYDMQIANKLTTKFTIETWAYQTGRSSSTGYTHLFDSIIGLGQVGLSFGIDHDGYFKLYHQSGGTNYTVASSSTVSLNTWTHLAAIVDGSQGTSAITLKINGSTVGTGSWYGINDAGGGQSTPYSSPHFNIGRVSTSFAGYQQYQGFLQDLRISNTALTINAAPTEPLKG